MRENYDIAEKSSKYLLQIITLVSSGNKIGSDKVFIVGSRSFIYTYMYYESKRP
jgi:hypothetical protein